MVEFIIEIKDCSGCLFATEYCGDPEDYYVCDVLKRDIVSYPKMPPWRPLEQKKDIPEINERF